MINGKSDVDHLPLEIQLVIVISEYKENVSPEKTNYLALDKAFSMREADITF